MWADGRKLRAGVDFSMREYSPGVKGDAFQYYHTIFDTYKTVRFDSYEPVFRLVRDFIERY